MSAGASHRTERLMCLVFILKARGRRGITRAELKTVVEDYAACPTEQAFERMLERDKRDLRDAGVAIDVVQRDAWHEDEHAYVLAQDALAEMPTFTADELRVLGLAAEAWERSTWQALASGALHKVEVFGAEFAADAAPRIALTTDRHLNAIRRAVRDRASIHFTYRRPGDRDPMSRHVEPWGLVHRDGGWYCIGWDRERRATRVFRTSRIVDSIVTGDPATSPIDGDWATMLDAYFRDLPPTNVVLLVEDGHGWFWRTRGSARGTRSIAGRQYDEIDVSLKERDGFVGSLAASAPHVLVVEPADLRMRVIEHLQGVARG